METKMENKIIVHEQHCFVCGDDLNEFKKSLLDSTKFSDDKQIYKYLEAFVDEQFEELVFSPSTNAAEVCEICVEKLEEYDRFCLEAARIQDEIASKYRSTQALMHTQNESFKCSACLEQYNSIDELHSHECFMGEQYEDLQEYADYEEEELVETTENLPSKKSPKKYEPLIYTCNKCNVKFQRKQDYQKHSKLSHVPENTEFFSCSLCKDGDPSVDTLFASEMDYKLHNVLSHPEDPSAPSFNCPICFKIFEKKSVLNRHFGIHSSNSDRPHVCEICGKSYFHFSSFQSHNKIHADIRDFPCKQCSKSFRSQSHLNRHKKIHTKQKDHECQDCGKSFAERYNLTAHLKTHLGISRRSKNT